MNIILQSEERMIDEDGNVYHLIGHVVDTLLEEKSLDKLCVPDTAFFLDEQVPWAWNHEPAVHDPLKLKVEPYDPEETLDLLENFLEGIDDPVSYLNRIDAEMECARDPRVAAVLACSIATSRILKQNGIMHGVGRGSACASLILFLHGVHYVDPVKFDIPMQEFYKFLANHGPK